MRKPLAGVLFILMTISGGVDSYRLLLPSLNTFQMYSSEDLALAEWVREYTDPNSIWLTGWYHNNFLFNLTGRRAVMTYDGWMWTHGYPYESTYVDVIAMMEAPFNYELFDKYNIGFVLLGPVELGQNEVDIEQFYRYFTPVKKTKHYTVFSTGRSQLVKEPPALISEGSTMTAERDLMSDYFLVPGCEQNVYPNIYFSGRPKISMVTSKFDFKYDAEAKRPIPVPCSIEWNGYLRVAQKGSYELIIESDDGSWLYLNDALLIDNGGEHDIKRGSKKIFLEEGYHKFTIRYFDGGGGAAFQWKWVPPGKKEQPVDGDALYHDTRNRKKGKGWLLD